MKCYVIAFQFTQILNIETPTGDVHRQEVVTSVKRIVAPRREYAEIEVRRGRHADPAFHILSCEEWEIDAIIDVQRRLER